MQQFGFTRTSVRPDHALLTPDSFVRAPLPGFFNSTCVVHVGPALGSGLGAGFCMYSVECEAGAVFGDAPANTSRFVFVQEGVLQFAAGKTKRGVKAQQYVFVPPGLGHRFTTKNKARVLVIEKPVQMLEGQALPELLLGDANTTPSNPVMNDPGVQVQQLLPDHLRFDFAVNTMTFAPGAALSLVETHVMEHGLVMLEGGGVYRLGDQWYPVVAGDVIYMGPFCPQWFGCIGKTKARYLIYKDWNRHPLAPRF